MDVVDCVVAKTAYSIGLDQTNRAGNDDPLPISLSTALADISTPLWFIMPVPIKRRVSVSGPPVQLIDLPAYACGHSPDRRRIHGVFAFTAPFDLDLLIAVGTENCILFHECILKIYRFTAVRTVEFGKYLFLVLVVFILVFIFVVIFIFIFIFIVIIVVIIVIKVIYELSISARSSPFHTTCSLSCSWTLDIVHCQSHIVKDFICLDSLPR
jgi:hypothetical protein